MAVSMLFLVGVVLGADDAGAAPAPPVEPTVRATPWPQVLPCARPTAASWDSRAGGPLVWASADGAASLTFAPETKQPMRLASRFPIEQLTHVTRDHFSGSPPQSQGQFQTWLVVSCQHNASIAWGTCDAGGCAVEATYARGTIPRAARTSRWTHPRRSPWELEAPELHYSLFHKLIGDKKPDDDATARASLRFARDAATDFRQLVAAVCLGGRCGHPVRAANAALAAFLGDKTPRYASQTHSKAPDNWSVDWVWTATGGGTTLTLACWDQVESPVLGCTLDFDLPGDIRVEYHPRTEYGRFAHDVAFTRAGAGKDEEPLGTIDVLDGSREDPWTEVEIAGQALALRPPRP